MSIFSEPPILIYAMKTYLVIHKKKLRKIKMFEELTVR